MHFEILKQKSGKKQEYVRQVKNGRVLNSSEGYANRDNVLKNIRAVTENFIPGLDVKIRDFSRGEIFVTDRGGLLTLERKMPKNMVPTSVK